MRSLLVGLLVSLGTMLAHWAFAGRRASASGTAALAARAIARTIARTAREIAQRGEAGREPELLRALKSWSTRNDPDAAAVCAFVLDALLRVDAAVPAAALRPVLRGANEPAALALLVRSARLNELEVLASFRTRAPRRGTTDGRDLRWLAEGNVLCGLRTPGFAALLLRDIDWTITVDAAAAGDGRPPAGDDAGARAAAAGVRPDGAATANGALAAPVFPGVGELGEVPWYRLCSAVGDVVADGPAPVRCRREPGPVPGNALGVVADPRAARDAWLARLVDGDVVPSCVRVVVATTASERLAAEVERARAQLLDARRRLLCALAGAGALTPAEVVAANRPVRVDVREPRARQRPAPGAAAPAAAGGSNGPWS